MPSTAGLFGSASAFGLDRAMGINNSLSSDDIAERAKATVRAHESSWRSLIRVFHTLYLPNKATTRVLLVVGLVTVTLALLSARLATHDPGFSFLRYNDGNPPFDVTFALSAIALSLVLLIAEGFAPQDPASAAHVLLRESYAFPVLVFTVTALVCGLVRPATWFNALLALLVASLVSFALYRVIATRLSPLLLDQKRRNLLADVAESATRAILQERAGSGHLRAAVEKYEGIRQAPSTAWLPRDHRYVLWTATQRGIISNIRLDKLRTLLAAVRRIRAQAPSHAFAGHISFDAAQRRPSADGLYLLVDFGQEVGPDTDGVVLVLNQQLDSGNVEALKGLASGVYSVGDDEGTSDEYDALLAMTEERYLAALGRHSHPGVVSTLRSYRVLVDSYLRVTSELGVRFTRETTRAEWSRFTNILPIADAAPRTLQRMVRVSALHGDSNLLSLTANMPSMVASVAMMNYDYMAFDSFMRVHVALLRLRREVSGPTAGLRRKLLLKAYSRGLRDVAIMLRERADGPS